MLNQAIAFVASALLVLLSIHVNYKASRPDFIKTVAYVTIWAAYLGAIAMWLVVFVTVLSKFRLA